MTNQLTFTFKNEDQKAQDVSAKTVDSGNYYQLEVVDSDSQQSVITKTLKIPVSYTHLTLPTLYSV